MAVNILDNQNYINRDFQTVYKELVDTVGKLNNKWLIDGEGNESDPGVIIVKELAACVDKLSYIADKYQLENYPETVQLDSDARRIFSPVYNMKWYRSCEGHILVRNIGEETITLPQRLMVCSEDKENVYTINAPGTVSIEAGAIEELPVIEGRLKTLTVNGSDQITIDNLIDNKIYIDDYSVAENGIWVQAYNSANNEIDEDVMSSTEWKQSYNLYAEDWSINSEKANSGQYFEFKIDTITGRPYLQFVDDIVNKIGDGLKIQYVVSSGSAGSVSAGKLTEVYAADSELTIDSDNLQIVNLLSIANGKDPETVDEGRIGYLKNIDICNTLVTLRDYANYIYNNGEVVSNCFVCDQNNDVQYAYNILTEYGQVKKLEIGSGLTVYSLKFYGIGEKNPQLVVNNALLTDEEKNAAYADIYKQTFEPVLPTLYGQPAGINDEIDKYIDEVKSINHEFGNIRNINRISFVKNYYTLTIDLLFKQTLTSAQIQNIQNTVYYNLLTGLNARNINFGDRVTYNKIQQLVYASDDRILGASIRGVDDADFKSYALFWDPYLSIPFYADGNDPTNTAIGDRWVIYDGSNYIAKEQLDGSVDTTTVTYYNYTSLPITTDQDYFGVVSATNHWFNSFTTLTNGNSYYICVQEPTTVISGLNDDPVVAVEIKDYNGTPANTIAYPTTPQQVTYTSGTGFIFKSGGIAYVGVPIETGSGTNKYLSWNYGKDSQFYYNETGSNVNGQFHELFISSEINELGRFDTNNEMGMATLKGNMQVDIFAKAILNGATPLYDFDNGISLTLQNKNIKASQRVSYIEPRLEIDLTSEYTLDKNEYIQIFTPEFDTIAEYAFYVYAGYYNTLGKDKLTITKETNYKLQSGEYIIFYARSDDESNYNYYVYGNGFIISPSKTVNIYNLSFQSVFCTSTKEMWKAHGICTAAINKQVSDATTATYAQNRLTAFKSQDSCSVKEINQETISTNTDYKYYTFITNSQNQNNEYVINFVNGYYIIEETESFSVYDINSDLVIILGAGCVLKSNLASITSDGITPVAITSSNEITYTLCEIRQFEVGTAIRPVVSMSIDVGTAPSSSTSTDYDGETDPAKKIEINATTLSQSVNGSNYNIANIASGVTNPYNSSSYSFASALQELVESALAVSIQNGDLDSGNNQTIYIKFNNYRKVNGAWTVSATKYYEVVYNIDIASTPVLNHNPQPYGDSLQLEYREPDSDNFVLLNLGDLGSSFTPLIRATYCVDVAGTAQNVYTYKLVGSVAVRQSVYGYQNITQTDDKAIIKIANSTTTPTVEVLNADNDIYILGGKQKLAQITSVYSSQLSADFDDPDSGSVHYNSSDISSLGKTTVFVKPGQSVTVTVPEQVYSDGWIAFATVGTSSTDAVSITITDGASPTPNPIETLYGDTISSVQSGDKLILANTSSSGEMVITNNDVTDTITLSFSQNIIRYSERTDLSYLDVYGDILGRLKVLDPEQQYYIVSNRTYPIYNPLSASSFFDTAHPYHNYTICQCSSINWR